MTAYTPAPNRDLCFAAGTLIHTAKGCVPIENIQVGDAVLSQPDAGGERSYKRVLRTFSAENREVCRLYSYDGERNETLILTADHPFFVPGYDTESMDPDYVDEYLARAGWRRADLIDSGALLELANGGTCKFAGLKRIWRTATEGVGWMQISIDSTLGNHIDLRDGLIVEHPGLVYTDFTTDESFLRRLEDESSMAQWSYKCKVYGIEVEDFHTYYVGEMGIWVRDANSTAPGRQWQYRFDESD